jgi:urease accessory protein UreE
MKQFTLTSKINPKAVLTITAKDWDEAEKIAYGLGLDLQDWDF